MESLSMSLWVAEVESMVEKSMGGGHGGSRVDRLIIDDDKKKPMRVVSNPRCG